MAAAGDSNVAREETIVETRSKVFAPNKSDNHPDMTLRFTKKQWDENK